MKRQPRRFSGCHRGLSSAWLALTPLRQAQDRPSLSEGERARQSCVKQQGRWFTGRAKRWPGWTSNPFLAVPRSAGRGAGGQRSMPASCSDSLPLFERRERSECSESGSAAPRPSIAGCPKGHGQWGRLSLPTFFGGAKKVGRPPGRTPGRQRIQVTINSIADCAFPTSASARFH